MSCRFNGIQKTLMKFEGMGVSALIVCQMGYM